LAGFPFHEQPAVALERFNYAKINFGAGIPATDMRYFRPRGKQSAVLLTTNSPTAPKTHFGQYFAASPPISA